jgi:hypothetical protein
VRIVVLVELRAGAAWPVRGVVGHVYTVVPVSSHRKR